MSAYDLLPCTHRQHVSNKDCYYAHERLALEARIIRGLIRGLKKEGWHPFSVNTGIRQEVAATETEMMDHVFSVDESWITFNRGDHKHSVMIVLGNGVDCIPDYTVCRSDDDGWNTLMERITDELMEKYDG